MKRNVRNLLSFSGFSGFLKNASLQTQKRPADHTLPKMLIVIGLMVKNYKTHHI